MQSDASAATKQQQPFDVKKMAQDALASAGVFGLVVGGIYFFGKAIEAYNAQFERARTAPATPTPSVPVEPEHVVETLDLDAAIARLTLEAAPTATADEIRRALRRKLTERRLHPDQGGDGIDAKRLIDAKNLLIERLKERDGDG